MKIAWSGKLVLAGFFWLTQTAAAASECTVNGKPVSCEAAAQTAGTFLGYGLVMIIVLGILGALTTVIWVLMIIHAAKHVEPKRVMWIWIGIMAVTGVLGAIIYYFMVKRKMDHSLRSASASTSTNDFGIVPPVPSTTPSPAAGVSLAASAPATVTIPTSPSTAAHLKQSFTSGKGLWMIIGIVVAVNILIFAGWYFLRDTKSTPSKSTKGATIQEKTTPVPSQMYAQVGDVSQVRLSNLQKSGGIPIRMKIARIIKLLPENGKATIDLKACSEEGCHPLHPVAVDAAEAIIALDLEFTNETTSTGQEGLAYFEGHIRSRFKVNGNYQDALQLKYVQSMDKWFEQKPTFYIEPATTMKVTFWVRVPKDTMEAEFLYAEDFSRPEIRVLLSFPDPETFDLDFSKFITITGTDGQVIEVGQAVGSQDPCTADSQTEICKIQTFKNYVGSLQAALILKCDNEPITIGGNVVASQYEANFVKQISVQSQNCGVQGTGKFSLAVSSAGLATTCSATVSETRVDFVGC